jgi:molecular chaperone HscB
MLVEFIGVTGAGTTTLLEKVQSLLAPVVPVITSAQLFTRLVGLGQVRNLTLQNLIQEVAGFPFCVAALSRHRTYLRATVKLLARTWQSGVTALCNVRSLERKLALDAADLESRFHKLNRKLHPDRFGRATPAERERALEASAVLNDAYRTLRDPVARAEYVLKLQEPEQAKSVPQELLDEVFELNMALEELRGGDDSVRPQLEAARDRFLALRRETDNAMTDLFSAHDRSGPDAVAADLRALLNRRKYIDNLVQQVESELSH